MTVLLRPAAGDGRFVAVSAAVWAGAALATLAPVLGAVVGTAAVGWAALRRHATAVLVAVGLGAGLVSGAAAAAREAATVGAWVPEGAVTVLATVMSDPVGPQGAERLTVRPDHIADSGGWTPWPGPRLLVTPVPAALSAGERVMITGTLRRADFRVLQGAVAGRLTADSVVSMAPPRNPLLVTANGLRNRVLESLEPFVSRPEGALLSGFLIGDVRRLPGDDYEALRLAGISHFVVVSGSNVALFLAALWIASGPLAWSPRRRVLVGLGGIVVFALVTRWEPSVLRASAMAAAVLLGRLSGWHLSAVRALAVAVTALVLVSGGIVWDVGFQLSVAATAGILIGAPVWVDRRPLWVWATLGATMSAQVAVAPILLAHFGAVPLVAPATNLISAPLVAASTAIGGVGAVFGLAPMIELAVRVAGVVLFTARAAADFDQVGWVGVVLIGAGGIVLWRLPRLRGPGAVAGVVVVALGMMPVRPPSEPVAVFLDVGQGDATLFIGPHGETVLVDGGPDPVTMRRHLRRHGVRRIDLLILTHRHADHAAGLVGITTVARVGTMWHPPQQGHGGAFDQVVDEVRASGARVGVPAVGARARIGSFDVRVLGPVRRYASPNDGSVVAVVEANGVTVAMTGDIEAHAQRDLGPIGADVMKVPHQGAATSLLEWLAASAPSIAIVTVGPNNFGHPSDEVIATLEGAGAIVRRTDHEGSITLRLTAAALGLEPLPSAR